LKLQKKRKKKERRGAGGGIVADHALEMVRKQNGEKWFLCLLLLPFKALVFVLASLSRGVSMRRNI
jgi:hypothetical protein